MIGPHKTRVNYTAFADLGPVLTKLLADLIDQKLDIWVKDFFVLLDKKIALRAAV